MPLRQRNVREHGAQNLMVLTDKDSDVSLLHGVDGVGDVLVPHSPHVIIQFGPAAILDHLVSHPIRLALIWISCPDVGHEGRRKKCLPKDEVVGPILDQRREPVQHTDQESKISGD